MEKAIIHWCKDANSIIYFPTAYFTKVPHLLLIGRVYAVKGRAARSIHIFIVILFVAYLPAQIVKIVICIPIRAYWDPSVDGRCLNQRKIFLFGLALAIFTDFVIPLLLISLTWSLRKIKIIALLGAGGVATGMTILRMYKAVKFRDSNDVMADFQWLMLTTILLKQPTSRGTLHGAARTSSMLDRISAIVRAWEQCRTSQAEDGDVKQDSNQGHGINNHETNECVNSISANT
ncbi:unnamed protein product [Clonostachys chloroleuca]|uniref:Rhodopsin domain-containing protein n=1 Tax=Clonostachys chloroleuca TaxID=1926264 RepID=A0AA35Q491_9HYPO|nr:unnamed protein product [Clonostachys chloroleuca]